MATLANIVGAASEGLFEVGEAVPNYAAVLLGLPVAAKILADYGGSFQNMSTEKAVSTFAIFGGLSGALSQYAAGQRMSQVSRNVDFIELVPALMGSIGFSLAATIVLLPPSPLYGTIRRGFLEPAGLV